MRRRGYVLFDCFGLFGSDTFVDFFRSLGDEDLRIKDELCAKGDYGYVTLDEVMIEMSKRLHKSREEIFDATLAKFQTSPEMFALAKSLRKHHKTALLSNCMVGSMDLFRGEPRFLSLFDHVFLSCDIHKIKPHKDYFEYCLSHIDNEDTPIVFFDDNPKNVVGAKDAGIDAVLFTSVFQAKEELRKRGFTLEEENID